MKLLIIAACVAFFAYSVYVVIDASGWGLPRLKRAPRVHCTVGECRASFVANDLSKAVAALRMHDAAAHQDEEAPQLWPRELPSRNRDFSTRQARVVQDTIRKRDVVIVGGFPVRLIRGGRNG